MAVAGFGILALGAFVTPGVRVADGVAPNTEAYLLANLLGANEVPTPGDPDGIGSAGVYVSTGVSNDVCWTLKLTGIDAVTGAQLHSGAAGVSGPVVIDFGVAVDTCALGPLDPALVLDISTNPRNYYVNIDTTSYPGGALRGQLVNNAVPLTYIGLATPVRAYDSRVDGNRISPNETRAISLFAGKDAFGVSLPAVPIGAYAADVVITVTQTGPAGFLTAHAAGTPVPATSTINWTLVGTTVANGTMVRVDSTSHVAITAGPSADTHVIIDVVGFYYDWQLTATV
ncbi:MAG: CHRD domain-containing protein [Actinomycetia bacterium]|nr:CHRD domain-containing protein [Actinomycetes bacterium]